MHVFPYSPRPGTVTAADDPVPAAVKKERGARLRELSRELSARRWRTKLGATEHVLVDRPGRGYGDDYSPWLVDAPVGALVRARAARRDRGGNPCRSRMRTVCSAASRKQGAYRHKAKGFVAIDDINPQAPVHVLVLPERHVDTFRDVGEFDARETKRMLEFVAETAEKVGLKDYRVLVNVGASAGQTVFHLHWHILGGGDASSVDVPAAVATAEVEQ